MKKEIRFALFAVLLVFLAGGTGCGIKQKTPEEVVTSLIESYAAGKEKKVKQCYPNGAGDEESLQKEITATLAYFESGKAKEVKVQECAPLEETEDYTYVYVTYYFVLEDGQEYPCVDTYMVRKDGKKYYIIPPSEITTEMSDAAAAAYAEFMTTDTYKTYTKEHEAFLAKNPSYESTLGQ